jgi:hypothetical protein
VSLGDSGVLMLRISYSQFYGGRHIILQNRWMRCLVRHNVYDNYKRRTFVRDNGSTDYCMSKKLSWVAFSAVYL